MLFREAVVGLECVEQFQTLLWAVHHRRGDGAIQQDHRIVGHAGEEIVEGENLRPIGVFGARRFVVDRGNGCLQLVGADRPLGKRSGKNGYALGDRGAIPKRSILFRERNEFAGRAGSRRHIMRLERS